MNIIEKIEKAKSKMSAQLVNHDNTYNILKIMSEHKYNYKQIYKKYKILTKENWDSTNAHIMLHNKELVLAIEHIQRDILKGE